MIKKGNIRATIPEQIPYEITEILAGSQAVKIERIISRGHCSVEGFWYDQDYNEWVLLLQGKAGLAFADQSAAVELTAGDYINIPAHVRHRVAWTAEDTETIWLAVKY
jgi:cupin 2 domain-containing protein